MIVSNSRVHCGRGGDRRTIERTFKKPRQADLRIYEESRAPLKLRITLVAPASGNGSLGDTSASRKMYLSGIRSAPWEKTLPPTGGFLGGATLAPKGGARQ